MKTIILFPEYDVLNPTEQLFYELIHDLETDSLWRDAINQFLSRPSLPGFRRLVSDLKSQANDNADVMKDILGVEAFEVLKSL